jgi:hypothetical protein
MRRAIFGVAIPALLISTSIGSPPMASSAWSKARSIEDTSDTSISTAGGTTRRTTSQASASPDLTRRRLGLSRRTVNRVALSRQLRGERIESIDSPCRDNNSRAGSREDFGEVVPKAPSSQGRCQRRRTAQRAQSISQRWNLRQQRADVRAGSSDQGSSTYEREAVRRHPGARSAAAPPAKPVGRQAVCAQRRPAPAAAARGRRSLPLLRLLSMPPMMPPAEFAVNHGHEPPPS